MEDASGFIGACGWSLSLFRPPASRDVPVDLYMWVVCACPRVSEGVQYACFRVYLCTYEIAYICVCACVFYMQYLDIHASYVSVYIVCSI
jgi:hypothetical protein